MSTNDFLDEVRSGDRVRGLIAIRDALANEMKATEGKDVAPLARELQRVMAELERLGAAGEVTPLDELAGRVDDEVAAARARRAAAAEAV